MDLHESLSQLFPQVIKFISLDAEKYLVRFYNSGCAESLKGLFYTRKRLTPRPSIGDRGPLDQFLPVMNKKPYIHGIFTDHDLCLD